MAIKRQGEHAGRANAPHKIDAAIGGREVRWGAFGL